MTRGTRAAVWLLAAALAGGAAPAPPAPPAALWPHTITEGASSATVYQPQAMSWPGQSTLNARAAIAIKRAGGGPQILGTVEIAAATRTDLDDRTVALSDVRVTASHFPSLDTAQAAEVDARIRAAAARIVDRHVPLDSVLASLRDTAAGPHDDAVATDNSPPVIFHSEQPASLVVFDGEPVLAPIAETGLSLAVNTNWSLLSEPASGRWFLLDNGAWLGAPGYAGPYQPVSRLPPAFTAIPAEPNYADIRAGLPGRKLKAGDAPTVFVSTKPAEIIVTDGPVQLASVAGTSLQFVRNTVAKVVFDPAAKNFYVLLSGRWFRAPSLDGPWAFASADLPPDFAHLPATGPLGDVQASVPGTAAAEEAVISAQIPRQTTLKRDATITVAYVGAPAFRPIPGTELRYAVNTTAQVIEVAGLYYACENGAWFVAKAATGPWVLADSVPPAIYTIPPSSPLHNVTYVHVYTATPEVVVAGYTAGYVMGIVSTAGVVVYGTGYVYPPFIVPAPVPVYLPYPYTYAGHVTYDTGTGVWGRGGTVYGPYGTATGGSVYNPATGAYARGGAVYGPYGGAGAWSAYNPTTGAYAHGSAAWGANGGSAYGTFANPTTGRSGSTTQNWNPYSRWGSSTVSGPNKTVNTASASNRNGSVGGFTSSTGAEGAGYRGARGNSGGVAKGANGDVYAGHDGNAYQHTDSGWSKWDNGGWQPVTPPTRPTNTGGSVGSTNSPTKRTGTQRPAQASAHPQMSQDNYSQLERDRQARTQPSGGWQGRAQRGGGGGGGGGRFRR